MPQTFILRFTSAIRQEKKLVIDRSNVLSRLLTHIFFLHIDKRSAYTSITMKELAEAYVVLFEEAPIEAPDAIDVVKTYDTSLRLA